MTIHRLEPEQGTVTQTFSRDAPPVLTIDSGDTLIVRTLDARGSLSRPRDPRSPQMFVPRLGHCLTGPIAIRGAEPGMTLAVHLTSFCPTRWGWTRAQAAEGTPAFLVWDLDPDGLTGTTGGIRVGLAPFLGVIGMPPDLPGEHPTTPPRTLGGGNIDCRELVAGSTLYLPVTVPGALLCVGDGHAAQGDGEVSGTAIECGMTSEIQLSLVDDPPLATIHAVTPRGRLTFGFSADLNEAVNDALTAMITWMCALFQVDRTTALALASVAVSLRVTQIVNQTWGAHALLPERALTRTAPSA